LPTVSIIVPVKNEERVVGRLLSALLNLDYPPEKREIIIVDDGSVDGTVGICTKYVRQHPGQIRLLHKPVSSGKPAALNYALKHAKGEIVATFDADNVPGSDVLLEAVRYFEDPSVAGVQGTVCAINADENMLTKFISYEEAVRFEAYIRGKDVLRLFVNLAGTCQFIRRDALEEVGGWNEESLTEDMEVSVRLMEKGYNIRYAPEARSWQEHPAKLRQLIGQRIRWCRGNMEIALRYGKLVTRLDRRSVDAEFTLAGPYMLTFCLLGYLMALCTLLVPVKPDPLFTTLTQVTSFLTAIPLFFIGLALVYTTKPRRVSNLLWLPFIYAYWSLETFIASYALVQILLKRSRRWTQTVKTGAITNPDVVG
jgi:cellulose synthase/poly-beta-1,6-N-acetylglucosamine synthase-like glycosyltransferase